MNEGKALRKALGCYATGVTIITTIDENGKNYGLTANSFNSVSLDPPLILWSLDKKRTGHKAFDIGRAFAVHVLSEDQVDYSNAFAVSAEDKFEGLDYHQASDNVPLLPGCAAVFQCETHQMHDAGDHIIVIGRVKSFDTTDKPPLVYHRGSYCRIHPGTA